ncbi:transcriptional regulator [Caballeronia fortuita]|uniref:Transcriptional regulator n=1 Tax=Caballeronia fortuita TaxID=1777138 RepID=A0A158E9U3_9BURK|nr:helix-turn-helix transcriptional regulator [Caballeronia fortuita]SAL03652.1 transcriptional regulator [Caballeronia fortuita]
MDYSLKTSSQLRPILLGFRKAAGLTQADVAARLGVTQQTYAQLEANPAAVSVERLFKVLRVLDVDIALSRPTKDKAVAAPAPPPVAAKATPARKRASAAKKRENW